MVDRLTSRSWPLSLEACTLPLRLVLAEMAETISSTVWAATLILVSVPPPPKPKLAPVTVPAPATPETVTSARLLEKALSAVKTIAPPAKLAGIGSGGEAASKPACKGSGSLGPLQDVA